MGLRRHNSLRALLGVVKRASAASASPRSGGRADAARLRYLGCDHEIAVAAGKHAIDGRIRLAGSSLSRQIGATAESVSLHA